MFLSFFKQIVGSRNSRILNNYNKKVNQINLMEGQVKSLSDVDLRNKTNEFKSKLAKGESLSKILPEAFAVVREASVRTLGMRHFDVQLIGGMALNDGKIAEMRTGEGKTLVATLPVYLNALKEQGVHVVTVNDYLAKRDSSWMLPLYEFLGLSVGVIYSDMSKDDRKNAYNSDVTYGTNNEFGFDYLRDNMCFKNDEKVQREHSYAMIDEVDSILIDEARTPLIISGAAENSSDLYYKINSIIPKLTMRKTEEGEGDFFIDEKQKQAYLTEEGHQSIESLLSNIELIDKGESLYSANNIKLMHHVTAALRAHVLYNRDVDYIIQNNSVVIVDEHTGRTMPGRRWSDGLHQAIEAKENVTIQNENQTMASITFQNFFKIYNKISGMTGTADTEAYEFQQIYNLEVIVIPTNKLALREDESDLVYLTTKEKYDAIIKDIKKCTEKQQPVLVGTASIEASDLLSSLLHKEGIKHQVLNAKFHEKEAHIIAQAGKPSAVTIATNMAGRGTDIVLGGSIDEEVKSLGEKATKEQIDELRKDVKDRNKAVIDSGGLRIIGSERHESRRIDNQLRGRSGRQGDPGSSRFYLSLEDNLMRIFASDKVSNIMKTLGLKDGESLEHKWINKVIENAQRKVEGHHFDIRKQLLEYDNVANEQRHVIYNQRNDLMDKDNISNIIIDITEDVISDVFYQYVPMGSMEEQWDIQSLESKLNSDFGLVIDINDLLNKDSSLYEVSLKKMLVSMVKEKISSKEELIGVDNMQNLEKAIMIRSLDTHWISHLASMDYLRQGIHLRGYAQKDPKQEYKKEAFKLFEDLLNIIKYEVISILSKVEVQNNGGDKILDEEINMANQRELQFQHSDENIFNNNMKEESLKLVKTITRTAPKIGRNEKCSCGSNKKYKNCCGKDKS